MNAKEELINKIKGKGIKCAKISLELDFDKYNHFILKVGYDSKDYEKFLNEIDFRYDSGFGGQQLYGIVWLEDGSWLERGEYDGSEWWEHKVLPEIPKECLNT